MMINTNYVAPVASETYERTWGKSAASDASLLEARKDNCSMANAASESGVIGVKDAVVGMVVEEHQNEPGRGPPKDVLIKRRVRQLGWLLQFLGLTVYEIFQVDPLLYDKLIGDEYKTWQERIPPGVLVGGDEENRQRIIENFLHVVSSFKGSNGKLAYDPSKNIVLLEHMEKHPVARTVQGQRGTLIKFIRDGVEAYDPGVQIKQSEDKWYYPFHLPPDEPSPVMFDLPVMRYFYVKDVGLSPVFHVPKTEFHYYLLVNKFIYPIKDTLAIAQLEPSGLAPNPSECTRIQDELKMKFPVTSPSDIAYYRGSKEYMERMDGVLDPNLIGEDIILIMEAYKIITRLMMCGLEATRALLGEHELDFNMDETRTLRALTYIIREVQLAPWNLSMFYKNLCQEYGTPKTPFPDGTRMRVNGFGGPNEYMVSYLPTMHSSYTVGKNANAQDQGGKQLGMNESTAVYVPPFKSQVADKIGMMEELTIPEYRKRKPKKKRSDWNKKDKVQIGDTDRDIRRVEMEGLGDILMALGVPWEEVKKVDRWDRCWLITKVASSHKGKHVLGGSLLKYVRNELTVKRNNRDHSKLELIHVKRLIEQESFFKEFRKRTKRIWVMLSVMASMSTGDRVVHPSNELGMQLNSIGDKEEEHNVKRPRYENENLRKTKQMDDLDDFSAMLGDSIMHSAKTEGDEEEEGKEEEWDGEAHIKKEKAERAWKHARGKWAKARQEDREGYVPEFAFKRRILYSYMDDGYVSQTGESISAVHLLYPAHRMPISAAINHIIEEGEEIIIEEGEEEIIAEG